MAFGTGFYERRQHRATRLVEREKGLEPSTSTLARWHSTTELLPRNSWPLDLSDTGGVVKTGPEDLDVGLAGVVNQGRRARARLGRQAGHGRQRLRDRLRGGRLQRVRRVMD